MAITVQELVNLPIFNMAKVVSGIEFLDKRKVEWVSAIEGPVENFVRKEELIVTTGMGCEHHPELFFEFVKDVYESGASALGVALGRYLFELPQDIIDFARDRQFVLIELPWELRFADIQRKTMEEINNRQQIYTEKARQVQKSLMDFVISGEDLPKIIHHVERELSCQIVFADSKGRVKATIEKPNEILDLWDELKDNAEATMVESEFRHTQRTDYRDGYMIKKEITSSTHNLVQGYYIIWMPDRDMLNPMALQMMESLTAATALWISREDAIVQTESRLRNDFFYSLAKTPQAIPDDNIQSRAKLLGYNLNMPYLCIVGYSSNLENLSEMQYENDDLGIKNIMYYIEEEVRYAASVVDRRTAFTIDNDILIIYLESQDEEQGTVHHFLDLVDKRLHALVPGVVFSWGIGMHQDGIMQFHKSYKKAYVALDLSVKQKESGERVSFDDTQLNRLLVHLANDDEVRDITLSTIKPLIEYEEKREMDLIHTFTAYDNQNGNVSQAARVLNLHRQSLLYRLRKIESLTHLSLDNPDDVFLLSISIKVWMTGAIPTKQMM